MSLPKLTDSLAAADQSEMVGTSIVQALADPSVSPLFWPAERLDRGSAWFGHIPFAHWIVWATRPRLFVELGTHAGISYSAFCHAIRRLDLGTRCFAVDTWEGDEHAGHYDNATFTDWKQFHDQRFTSFSTLLRSRFDDAIDKFEDGSIDLLHIDGLHTYEAVKHDFESWKPKLSDRAVVLFHDTNEREQDFGVWKLWAELCPQYPNFEFLHSHGLGVLCVGHQVPEQLLGLCASQTPKQIQAVRTAVEILGARWQLDAAERELRAALNARDAHIVELSRVRTHEVEATNAVVSAANAKSTDLTREVSAANAKSTDLTREVEKLKAMLALVTEAQEAVGQVKQNDEAKFSNAVVEVNRLGALVRASEQMAHEAVVQRDAILSSTTWRVTRPLRNIAAQIPVAVKQKIRKVAKTAYWAATPWKLGQRVRFLQERRKTRNSTPLAKSSPGDQLYHGSASIVEATSANYAQWIVENEVRAGLVSIDPDSSVGSVLSVSFLVPATGISHVSELVRTIDSIRQQPFPRWEALIGLSADVDARARGVLQQLSNSDERIKCIESSGNGKAVVFADLVNAASNEFIAVLDAGDVLSAIALNEIVMALADDPEVDVIYGDEDALSLLGQRDRPFFKPSWSPDLLYAFNYFGRVTLLRRSTVIAAGGIAVDMGVAAEWDLNLRITTHTQAIKRIPRVLCHRSMRSDCDRPRPDSANALVHQLAIKRFWATQGIEAKIETQGDGTQRSTWEIAEPPLVSIIIPTKNRHDLLQMCVGGILNNTDYRNKELIIVDTGSTEPETLALYEAWGTRSNIRIVNFAKKFNYSSACNYGASYARGELLLFLNNDIEIVSSDWLTELVRFGMRPGVGVVGTKLVYPTQGLQHAGVVIGMHLCGLVFRGAHESEWGVFGSPSHPRNYLAIMGACQLVRREVFDRVAGFDEAYDIANSDVALCLRAWRAGYRTAYTPFARLVHHEGATRGHSNPTDDLRRSAFDIRRLGFADDPYFHPGLSGTESIPALRVGGDPSTKESLQQITTSLLQSVWVRPELDLFDDYAVTSVVDLPHEKLFWSPQSVYAITDQWSAARYCMDLLRSRSDLRQRFPHALSSGASGDFAKWLASTGGDQLHIPSAARAEILLVLDKDPGRRVRQSYLCRTDLRSAHPLGLTPVGRSAFFHWMMRHGQTEESLRIEEIWWFFLAAAENPAAELIRTYRFTPAWQSLYPNGLTVFGRRAFGTWFTERFQISASWANPYHWPIDMSPARQIRETYHTREDWQVLHPDALTTWDGASSFLTWLASTESQLDDDVREWLSAISLTETAKELASPGVNIIGHFCYPSGLRTSVEAIGEGLRQAGVETSLRDLRTDKSDEPNHAAYTGSELFDTTLIHAQPEPFFDTAYAQADLFERNPRAYRIGYWYWELEQIPEFWLKKGESLDELWTATKFVADALKQRFNIPVHTMFPGVRLGSFQRRALTDFGLDGERKFTFLFTFHMMSIMERKNPLGLIRAFKQAFSQGEPVALVLKTSFGNRHQAQLKELHAAARGANVSIIDQVFTQDETLSLMNACDAYVSLHRSEGLGLTMAEAMLLGKPVIATRYSGNLDFMDDSNSLLVDYSMVKVGQGKQPYEANASWAEPSVEHAARLMRQLYENQTSAAELGMKAKADLSERVSVEAAGVRMRDRLIEISAQRLRR